MSYQRISSLAGARPSGFLSVIAGLLIITSPVFSAGLGSGSATCDAIPVDLGGSLRAAGSETGEPFLIELDVPSAGLLSLDVTVPGSASAEPKLGFAGPGCDWTKVPFEPALIERSATHLVLAAAPGRHVFRVASSDPLLPLGEFRLRTAFSPDGASRSFAKEGEDEEEIEIEANPLVLTKVGEDEEEIEIEANPLVLTKVGEDEEEIEIEANPLVLTKVGEDEEEIEIEANPLVHDGLGESRPLASRLDELCRSGEVDDHGDSFPCATFLGPGLAVAGEIGNGWRDDQDVFVVVVGGSPGSELATLEIEAAGEVDLVGVLYDRAGQRLAGNTDGDGFRIVRTVRPGTYFVRVGGRDGAEGFYALRVETSTW